MVNRILVIEEKESEIFKNIFLFFRSWIFRFGI